MSHYVILQDGFSLTLQLCSPLLTVYTISDPAVLISVAMGDVSVNTDPVLDVY